MAFRSYQLHMGAPFSSLRFRRLGSVVGPVRQLFLQSVRNHQNSDSVVLPLRSCSEGEAAPKAKRPEAESVGGTARSHERVHTRLMLILASTTHSAVSTQVTVS